MERPKINSYLNAIKYADAFREWQKKLNQLKTIEMKAEIFYKDYYGDDWQPKDNFDKDKKQFDYWNIIDFAEAYHKEKLNQLNSK